MSSVLSAGEFSSYSGVRRLSTGQLQRYDTKQDGYTEPDGLEIHFHRLLAE